MQSPEVIRREWPGFGKCRITVAPQEESATISLTDRIFAGMPRLFSRTGLGSLSFTVDPSWILREERPVANPVVLQFLRVHRQALAEEWRSRQTNNSVVESKAPARIRPRRVANPAPSVAAPAVVQGNDKGLPSWFDAVLRS